MNVGVSRLRHKVPPGHNSPLRRSVGASPDTLWVFRARHQRVKTETKMGRIEKNAPEVETKMGKTEMKMPEVETKTNKTEMKMPKIEMKTNKTEAKIQRRVAHATKFLRNTGEISPQTGGYSASASSRARTSRAMSVA